MAAAFCLLAASCSSEEDSYPSVITELVDVRTDPTGLVTDITTDRGTRFNVSEQAIESVQRDTLFRCRCTFLPTSTDSTSHRQTAKIYSIERIPSALPISLSAVDTALLAPYQTMTHWGNDRYYNLRVEYKTYGTARHSFVFIEDSISTAADGVLSAFVSLRHIQEKNTLPAYTSTVFVSFPLFLYTKPQHLMLRFETKTGIESIQIR